MMAVVGSDSSFQYGRQQLELLAGLNVTTKAVERQAEAIGADIAHREQIQAARSVQLEWPEILGSAVPVLYIGTQLPMVRAELEGRAGRVQGQAARTREVKLGCVFTQTTTDEEGRFATKPPPATRERLKRPRSLARIYIEAWERGWSRAEKKVIIADGAEWIWNIADQQFPGAIHRGRVSRPATPVGTGTGSVFWR